MYTHEPTSHLVMGTVDAVMQWLTIKQIALVARDIKGVCFISKEGIANLFLEALSFLVRC
jgi:hypothetical protein